MSLGLGTQVCVNMAISYLVSFQPVGASPEQSRRRQHDDTYLQVRVARSAPQKTRNALKESFSKGLLVRRRKKLAALLWIRNESYLNEHARHIGPHENIKWAFFHPQVP